MERFHKPRILVVRAAPRVKPSWWSAPGKLQFLGSFAVGTREPSATTWYETHLRRIHDPWPRNTVGGRAARQEYDDESLGTTYGSSHQG